MQKTGLKSLLSLLRNAPDWVETALAGDVLGVATVVYQSIVWQYLSSSDRAALRVRHGRGRKSRYSLRGRLRGSDSSQARMSLKSVCNFGPAAKTAYWPDPASTESRLSG